MTFSQDLCWGICTSLQYIHLWLLYTSTRPHFEGNIDQCHSAPYNAPLATRSIQNRFQTFTNHFTSCPAYIMGFLPLVSRVTASISSRKTLLTVPHLSWFYHYFMMCWFYLNRLYHLFSCFNIDCVYSILFQPVQLFVTMFFEKCDTNKDFDWKIIIYMTAVVCRGSTHSNSNDFNNYNGLP